MIKTYKIKLKRDKINGVMNQSLAYLLYAELMRRCDRDLTLQTAALEAFVTTYDEILNMAAEIPCDRRVIFSLRSNRFIGNGSAYDFNDGWYDKPYYDDTDGNIYSFDYAQLNDDIITPKKLLSQDSIYIRDWTVIGDYIYAEEYQLIKIEQKITDYVTVYMPVHQVRINLLTGKIDILTPINYVLEE